MTDTLSKQIDSEIERLREQPKFLTLDAFHTLNPYQWDGDLIALAQWIGKAYRSMSSLEYGGVRFGIGLRQYAKSYCRVPMKEFDIAENVMRNSRAHGYDLGSLQRARGFTR